MIIIKQLAAEFQIELAAELIHTFTDLLALKLNIPVVVKTNFKHIQLPPHDIIS